MEFDLREDGTPFSPNFDDVYFSSENGLAETEYVILRGNGLPQAWEQREDFSIIETGFGTGLNFLAALKAWRETQPTTSKLRFYTIEAFPLTVKQIFDEYLKDKDYSKINGLETKDYKTLPQTRIKSLDDFLLVIFN